MSIYWKKKFKPELVLEKISKTRTISPEGSASFSGFEFHEYMPVLASMLEFPESAERLNKSSLIWSALAGAKGDLNKDSFLPAINESLNKQLRGRIDDYILITSLSLKASQGFPKFIRILDASIRFLQKGPPKSYNHREKVLITHNIDIPDTPNDYLTISVAVRDKSPTSAAQRALDHIDLFRGLVALYENVVMQWSLSGSLSHHPINRIRCGGRHTIHKPDGSIAAEALWFDPNFRAANPHKIKNVKKLFKIVQQDLRNISKSPYTKQLISAITRYARAFDEPDANAAFLRLWSALESLTTPGTADYAALSRRCSFLYADTAYHHQVLEHLREYRNMNVHAGIESDDARINCFLLQDYFRTAVHFYKGNWRAFSSLAEANEFLDLPSNLEALKARSRILRKAQKFVTPPEM